MRAIVKATELGAALKNSVAATGKASLAVLQHVLITTTTDGVKVYSTDGEVFLESVVEAKVDGEGEALVHAQMLRTVADGGGELIINGDGRVSRGRSHYRIPVYADSSAMPPRDSGHWQALDLATTALADAIHHVSYTGDDQDVRAMIKAIHVMPGKVWATDGKQLGRTVLKYDGPAMAIPVYQVKRVMAALAAGGQLQVANVRNGRAGLLRIRDSVDDVVLRLLEVASLPVIERFVPEVTKTQPQVTIRRSEFIQALRRFDPFGQWSSDKKVTNYTVVLMRERDQLTLTDRAEENREDLTDMTVSGQGEFRIGMDPRMLRETLNAIRTDTFTFYPPTAEASGAVLLPDGADPDELVHVLMPVSI